MTPVTACTNLSSRSAASLSSSEAEYTQASVRSACFCEPVFFGTLIDLSYLCAIFTVNRKNVFIPRI